MGTMQRVGKTGTTINTDSSGITWVTYHYTPVVAFNDRWILLQTDGWQTATTKARMNQAANQFNLNFAVSQANFKWFVTTYKPYSAETGYEGIMSKYWENTHRPILINRKSGRIYAGYSKQFDRYLKNLLS